MNNILKSFFTAIFASIAGFFSAGKSYQNKVNEHNQTAYQELKEKLRPYGDQFILPLCKRDKDGVLIKNKKYLKYEKIMKERKAYLIAKRRGKVKAVMFG